MELKIYKSIDATSSSCSGPIGELSGAMNDAVVGECVEIIVGDQATRDDVLAWAAKTGNKVVGIREEGGKFRIVVERVK
ncbi:MAG: sulfurtransferase TusA family protein [Thermoprotei archaeon]